jgi:DNA-binding CsgD family transcriptional regulator
VHLVGSVLADSEGRRTTVERWYAACDKRDLDALLDLCDDEIEIAPAGPLLERLPGTSFHGRAGVRTLMTWAFSTYPEMRVTGLTTRPLDPWMLARVSYAGGESYALFEIEGGRIRRIRAFALESDALASAAAGVLTAREREILQLLVRGLNAPQIAAKLVLSPATVRTHVRNAMVSLGARTRVEAVALALKRGEIQL